MVRKQIVYSSRIGQQNLSSITWTMSCRWRFKRENLDNFRSSCYLEDAQLVRNLNGQAAALKQQQQLQKQSISQTAATTPATNATQSQRHTSFHEKLEKTYVRYHNEVRSIVRKAFGGQNILQMSFDTDLEMHVKNQLKCNGNQSFDQHTENYFSSVQSESWKQVIDQWTNKYNFSSASFRKMVWSTSSKIACKSIACFRNGRTVFDYLCRYSYIPHRWFHDFQIEPFARHKLNAKCSKHFDATTKLCTNSCPFHDQSEFCSQSIGKLCTHKSGLVMDHCKGYCLCPKKTIFFSPNPIDGNDYLEGFNTVRNFMKLNVTGFDKLNNYIKDTDLERNANNFGGDCTQVQNEWNFSTKNLVQFSNESSKWISNIRELISEGNETTILLDSSIFYSKIISAQFYKVGCAITICDFEFVYFCKFV